MLKQINFGSKIVQLSPFDQNSVMKRNQECECISLFGMCLSGAIKSLISVSIWDMKDVKVNAIYENVIQYIRDDIVILCS